MGATAGALSGGAAGYGAYAKRGEIQAWVEQRHIPKVKETGVAIGFRKWNRPRVLVHLLLANKTWSS